MRKKENLWDLLEQLDEQAGQYNIHLYEANRYFDKAAKKTHTLLARQEKELHATINKVRKALKKFTRPKDEKTGNDPKT